MEGPSNSLAGFPSRGLFTSTILPSSILGDGMRPYLSQHDTSPPKDQIIRTNPENILIRALQLSKQKNELKPKAVNGNIRNKRFAKVPNEAETRPHRVSEPPRIELPSIPLTEILTVDVLASKLYFYYSLSYEHTNSLSEIRGNLLSLHRMATLHHDELGQETLLNLLLRNYLHYNLYDQAEKLRSKAPRFEAHSNQQFCRYLFYLGKIRTIQLEYTDAKESLLQASRKAPTAARGFKIMCNKWAVIVRLLLGEIPERTIFMQNGMKKALVPYFELTNAVRIGDLELFRTATEKCSNVFSKDGTHNLIVRLRHNVIRTGLRNISISYSRISLIDVAKKLRLDSDNPVADAESIVAKAIRDGAIDATLDHTNGWMVSKETGDIYSTNEPQLAFNSRIAFCLNMHNEAVRALRFPPNSQKDKESAENRRERQQQEQELAKHLAEEDEF